LKRGMIPANDANRLGYDVKKNYFTFNL